MKRSLLVALLSCVVVIGTARAGELAIVGATVYASPEAMPMANATVLARDGRIAAIGPVSAVSVPAGATVIDAKGATVVAGFWNSHVHPILPDLMHADTRPAVQLEAALERMLTRWGFTAAFDIASLLPGNGLALRDRIERGELRGPLLLTVDAPFYPKDGTPIYVREAYRANGWPSAEVQTPNEARERARRQLAAGADGVKLFVGAIVGGNAGVLPMDVEIARAVVDEAHARGKPAFAHPSDRRGLEIAMASGVDVLAHTTPAAGPWPAELVDRLRAHRIALVPTLKLIEVELAKDNAPTAVRERFIASAQQQVGAYAAAGGTILFGTDVGYIEDSDPTREYRLMADAGLDWRAILASLTTSPAARFGFAARKGRLAVGMDADLVVLAKDPARDPTAFADVLVTIRGGSVLYRTYRGRK